MTAPPRRPWCRRKRAWAAAVLWLTVAYPLSALLLQYPWGRGLITQSDPVGRAWGVIYHPLMLAVFNGRGPRPGVGWYAEAAQYLTDLGKRHVVDAVAD